MDPFATFVLPVAMAPCIGSFAGVLVRRLPRHRAVGWARSRCEACAAPLSPVELIPIISFLVLRGRCRHCHTPIARLHLEVELAAIAIPLAIWAAGFADPAWIWTGCGLGWTLLTLAWIDAVSYTLPDLLTLPLILAGLTQTAWLARDGLADHALAATCAYGGFRAIDWTYRRLRGRDGLGQGDAKLFAAAGAWLGLATLPTVLLLAGVLGLMIVGGSALCGRKPALTTRIPFGPPLALGIWAVWLTLSHQSVD